MHEADRTALLLIGPGASGRMAYHALARAISSVKVIREGRPGRGEMIRRRARRLGMRQVAGQLAFQTLLSPALHRLGKQRMDDIKRDGQLDESPIPSSVVEDVPTINDPRVPELIAARNPSAIAVVGTRIIRKSILDAVRAPIFNLHVGITPAFRGVHGGYWALARQRPDLCGVTIHRVDPGIDTGAIVAQALVQPTPRDTFATYPCLQLAVGLPLLVDVMRQSQVGNPDVRILADGAESTLYYHPTLSQYLATWFLYGVR